MGGVWVTLIKYTNHGNQKRKEKAGSVREPPHTGPWLSNGSFSLLQIVVSHRRFLSDFTFLS